MPEEARCLVQFIHPGGEHRPNRSGLKPWNTGMHARKFMRTRGRWLEDGQSHEGDLTFWGEWEPPSEAEQLQRPTTDYPKFLHRPYLEPHPDVVGLQNTDPFVFGDRFLYTGCQQWRGKPKGYPVQLRFLLPGSVILFGSYRDARFLLDTALVVYDSIDHTQASFREQVRGQVSDAYWPITLDLWYTGRDVGRSFRLYRGATPAEPVNGMFSFFPCLPADHGATEAFPRPDLSALPGINPRLRQGWKATKLGSTDEAFAVWRRVVDAVERQELQLGVGAEIPALRRV